MSSQGTDKQSGQSPNVVPMRPVSVQGDDKAPESTSNTIAASEAEKKAVVKRSPAAKKQTSKKSSSKAKVAKKVASPKKSVAVKKNKLPAKVEKTASKTTQIVNEKATTKSEVVSVSKKSKSDAAFCYNMKPNLMEEMMSKSNKQFDAYAQEATEASREALDAAIKSSTIFAKGLEDIIRTSVALAQSAAEKQASYAKEAMTSKTINEWADLQNKYTQSSFDDFMAGATKLSEMAVKTLSDASEPVNEQVTKTMNTVQKAA